MLFPNEIFINRRRDIGDKSDRHFRVSADSVIRFVLEMETSATDLPRFWLVYMVVR
jgi:hypothetical protein